MKRKLVGLALLAPLAAIMPTFVRSCHQGGDVRNAEGGVVANLLALVFMISVPLAIAGLSLLFGKKKR